MLLGKRAALAAFTLICLQNLQASFKVGKIDSERETHKIRIYTPAISFIFPYIILILPLHFINSCIIVFSMLAKNLFYRKAHIPAQDYNLKKPKLNLRFFTTF
jgi:hypothetical protein